MEEIDPTDEETMLIQAAAVIQSGNERIIKLQARLDAANEENRTLRAALKKFTPYDYMCMDPLKCAGTGRCPRDPVCGN